MALDTTTQASLQAKEALLARLKAIRRGHNRDQQEGICGNIHTHQYLFDALACAVWGDALYPVGGDDEFYKEAAAGTLWDNPRRLQLLDKLIATLEDYIDDCVSNWD